MRRLSSSFGSLLKDAGRSSEVLEVLLGDDVLEFLRRPAAQQEALSIPGLKEQIRSLNLSLAALHGKRGSHGNQTAPLREEPWARLLLSVARRQGPPPVICC